jgi:hypothetical protein
MVMRSLGGDAPRTEDGTMHGTAASAGTLRRLLRVIFFMA